MRSNKSRNLFWFYSRMKTYVYITVFRLALITSNIKTVMEKTPQKKNCCPWIDWHTAVAFNLSWNKFKFNVMHHNLRLISSISLYMWISEYNFFSLQHKISFNFSFKMFRFRFFFRSIDFFSISNQNSLVEFSSLVFFPVFFIGTFYPIISFSWQLTDWVIQL